MIKWRSSHIFNSHNSSGLVSCGWCNVVERPCKIRFPCWHDRGTLPLAQHRRWWGCSWVDCAIDWGFNRQHGLQGFPAPLLIPDFKIIIRSVEKLILHKHTYQWRYSIAMLVAADMEPILFLKRWIFLEYNSFVLQDLSKKNINLIVARYMTEELSKKQC